MSREDLPAALAVVGLVPAVFASTCPPLSQVRGSTDARGHIGVGIGHAAVISAAVVGVAVLASGGSPTIGILGAAMVVAYSVAYMHARETPANGD